MIENSFRCFIAIEIPEEIQKALIKAVDLAHLIPENGFRPVRAGMIHITLKFLGDTTLSLIPQIKEELTQIAETRSNFPLQIKGLGAFTSWDHPRTIWAGIAHPPELQDLFAQINRQISPLGLAPDDRPFSPHLTLARVSERADFLRVRQCIAVLRQNSNMVFGDITVSRLVLFRSTLQPGGSIYTPVSTHDFGSRKV